MNWKIWMAWIWISQWWIKLLIPLNLIKTQLLQPQISIWSRIRERETPKLKNNTKLLMISLGGRKVKEESARMVKRVSLHRTSGKRDLRWKESGQLSRILPVGELYPRIRIGGIWIISTANRTKNENSSPTTSQNPSQPRWKWPTASKTEAKSVITSDP